jgi:hypothetical protein
MPPGTTSTPASSRDSRILLDGTGGDLPGLDDPQRNLLVLFKLHPLPGGRFRDPSLQDLTEILPEDKIDIPLE